ncbi:hypothetical protein DSO57_1034507 [Entomophthora muscae]|uniref:Uncharacterized protein n=1 Tax=Entomophthora muscae TaxID=34485 RepID=A0ACC2U9B9_9FUNG|nr:hypothetical protein DSO57_1034507 [Entomophthora muscae]
MLNKICAQLEFHGRLYPRQTVVELLSWAREKDLPLAIRVYEYCMNYKHFLLTTQAIDVWMVFFIQHLSWEKHLEFYELAKAKLVWGTFSLGSCIMILKALVRQFTDLRSEQPLIIPALANTFLLDTVQSKHGSNVEIKNLVFQVRFPNCPIEEGLRLLDDMFSLGTHFEPQSIRVAGLTSARRGHLDLLDRLTNFSDAYYPNHKFVFDSFLLGLLFAGDMKNMKKLMDMQLRNLGMPTPESFGYLIQILVAQDDMQGVMDMLMVMNDHNIPLTRHISHSVMQGFLKKLDFDSAGDLLEEMHGMGLEPDVSTVEALLCHASEAGNWEIIFRAYHSCRSKNIFFHTPKTFKSLIHAYLEVRDNSGVTSMTRALRRFLSSPRSLLFPHSDYLPLLQLLLDRGLSKELDSVYRFLISTGISTPHTFNHIVSRYLLKGQIEEAKRVYFDFISLGISPDSDSYDSAIILCAKSKDIPGLQKLYLDSRDRGIPLSQSTAVCLVKYLHELGDPEAALKVYHDIISHHPDHHPHLLEAAVCAQLDIHSGDEFESATSLIYFSDLKPTPKTIRLLLNHALFRSSSLEKANKVSQLLTAKEIPIDFTFWNALMEFHLSKGDAAAAIGIYEAQQHPNYETYSLLVEHFIGQGDFPGVMEWVNEMKRCAFPPETKLCNRILSFYCKRANYEEAFNIYEDMLWLQTPLDLETCRILAKLLIIHQRFHELLNFLESLAASDCPPDSNLLNMVLETTSDGSPRFFHKDLFRLARQYSWPISDPSQIDPACSTDGSQASL